MSIKGAPGVFDILPNDSKEEWKSSHLWNHVEKVMRETAIQYGYQEIRTPIFERSELFKRGVGETTDIVSKEMYNFEDRGGRLMSLRPEGTAPVVRSYIEHHMNHDSHINKLFYIGPMFRYERQQAGRYRQFHQFGAEVMGSSSPEQDAELIDLQYTIFTRLGLKNLRVMVSSLGNPESRKAFREGLLAYLTPLKDQLSEDSLKRFDVNPLRILDSKDPKEQKIIQEAPSILDYLNDEDKEHFGKVLRLLDSLNIPYEIDPTIVRGLDYYSRTVFEVISGELGAQNSVGGGGRYDALIKMLGGPDVPASGFATGIERVIQVMLKQEVSFPEPNTPILYFIPLGEKAKLSCFKVLHSLRREGIPTDMDYSGRKLGKVMNFANQINARFVAVVGDEELATDSVEIKEMATGEKTKVSFRHLGRILKIEAQGEDFVNVWKEMNTPFDDPIEAEYFMNKVSLSIKKTQSLTEELQIAMKKMKEIL